MHTRTLHVAIGSEIYVCIYMIQLLLSSTLFISQGAVQSKS